MKYDGQTYRKSKTLCFRSVKDGDTYIHSKLIDHDAFVVVRFKDCPIDHTEISPTTGRTIQYRDTEGVEGIPLSYHIDNRAYSPVKKSIWYYRQVYLAYDGEIYTRRQWLSEDKDIKRAMERDSFGY